MIGHLLTPTLFLFRFAYLLASCAVVVATITPSSSASATSSPPPPRMLLGDRRCSGFAFSAHRALTGHPRTSSSPSSSSSSSSSPPRGRASPSHPSFARADRADALFPRRGDQSPSLSIGSRRHRLAAFLASGATEGGNDAFPAMDDGDPLKWEKMYRASASTTSQDDEPHGGATIESVPGIDDDYDRGSTPTTGSGIRVVSFDLDDTIWRTSPTISDANDALACHLREAFGIDGGEERCEARMGRLFKRFPDRYAGVDHSRMAVAEADSLRGEEEGEEADSGVIVVARDDDEDLADIVQNVGRSGDVRLMPIDATATADDDGTVGGIHIQSSFGAVKKKPVYLTLLRKDAIRSMILAAGNDDGTDVRPTAGPSSSSPTYLEHQVDGAFEVWMEARCRSISENFAPSAVTTLRNLRSQLSSFPPDDSSSSSSSSRKDVYMCAITDGNSNPERLSELSSVFDFVIRAEDVGASKPDKRVFKAAVAALMLRIGQDGKSIEEFFLGRENVEDDDDCIATITTTIKSNTYIKTDSAIPPATTAALSWRDIEEEAVEAFSEAVGPWWVHVGDDFFKDVVAAKEFKMRTVWSRELIIGRSNNNNNNPADDEKSGSSGRNPKGERSSRTVGDLASDVAKSDGVLTMAIGESEFLKESLQEEFCDAILDRFDDLGDLLLGWHEEGMMAGRRTTGNDEMMTEAIVPEIDAAISWYDDQRQTKEDSSSNTGSGQPSYKFCVFCGAKLPVAAKFCSSCGERQ